MFFTDLKTENRNPTQSDRRPSGGGAANGHATSLQPTAPVQVHRVDVAPHHISITDIMLRIDGHVRPHPTRGHLP